MKSTTRSLLFVVVGVSLAPLAARADKPAEIRRISVSGSAEVHAPPDYCIISVEISRRRPELAEARKEASDLVSKIAQLAQQHALDESDVTMTYFRVEPRYEKERSYTSERKVLVGYEVSQGLSLTLRDLDKREDLLTDLLQNRVDRNESVTFKLDNVRKHADEVRISAVKAARAKATAMAEALGERVGRAISIHEGGLDDSSLDRPWRWERAFPSNDILAYGDDSGSALVTPDSITIRAEVTVVFELVDQEP